MSIINVSLYNDSEIAAIVAVHDSHFWDYDDFGNLLLIVEK